jgi:hypothetical protein
MPTPRVNGGIITDQMLAGKLLYFKMTGAFAYTVSDGTVTLQNGVAQGATPVTSYPLVGEDRPVPGSLADLALRQISERCSITEIGVIGAPGAETEIHFSCEGSAFGWIDMNGDVDVAAMIAAVATLGATVDVPTTSGGAVGDNTVAPATANVSTTVVITEVPFELA